MPHRNKPENADMPIRVQMLGGFTITIGTTVITDTEGRSFQLWNFLAYLITFRSKTIAGEELVQALWDEGEIENTSNALKNLAYRVRTLLGSYDIDFAKKIVVFDKGGYQWNNSLLCEVDIEELEDLHKKATDPSHPVSYRIEKYLQAIPLYKGDFLPAFNHKNWVPPIAAYYRTMFFKCVNEVLALLAHQERYAEVESVCKKALKVDQFEESAHKFLMLALVKQGKETRAIAHYRYVTDLFLHELGVNPSQPLRNLYRQLTRTSNSVEVDIGIIQQDLKEIQFADGAYYCEYEVFKNIYQVKARQAPRTGTGIYICLLTLTDQEGRFPQDDARKRSMDSLFRAIRNNTRSTDVFARFSTIQYVMLLMAPSHEDCEMMMSRIVRQHRRDDQDMVEIHTTVQLVTSPKVV